jgi:hypothetical protein
MAAMANFMKYWKITLEIVGFIGVAAGSIYAKIKWYRDMDAAAPFKLRPIAKKKDLD